MSEWSTIPVTPSGSTQVTINRLTPDTTYEFQVVGKNALGDGMLSKVISIKTLGEYINGLHIGRSFIILFYFFNLKKVLDFKRLTGVGNTVSVV